MSMDSESRHQDSASTDPALVQEVPWDRRFWIGLDLDGTLAKVVSLRPPYPIGAMIPAMKEQLDKWLAEGKRVKILTARIGMREFEHKEIPPGCDYNSQYDRVHTWLKEQGYGFLEITNKLDPFCLEIWNDRAVQVMKNQGVVAGRQQVLFGNAPESFEQGSIFMEVVEKIAKVRGTLGWSDQPPETWLQLFESQLAQMRQLLESPTPNTPLQYRSILIYIASNCFEAVEQYDRDMLPVHMDHPNLQPERVKPS